MTAATTRVIPNDRAWLSLPPWPRSGGGPGADRLSFGLIMNLNVNVRETLHTADFHPEITGDQVNPLTIGIARRGVPLGTGMSGTR